MKFAGFLLLLSGWMIAVAALILLPPASSQMAFLLAAIGVEIVGLVVSARAHISIRGQRR